MKTEFETAFEIHLNKFSTSPYLFVGSGLSTRYINTHGWAKLLQNICDELKFPSSFFYYNSKANNDLTKVSTFMADDLFEMWWKEPQFYDSRKAFAEKAIDKESPLKYEICRYFEKTPYIINKSYEEEYALLKKINVEGIIT